MLPLPWASDAERYSAISGMEELQTDVMRFMAILGLCLMAIFALVHSLPSAPAVAPPRLESVGGLKAELEALSRRVRDLRHEAETLQLEAVTARAASQRAQRELNEVHAALAAQQERLAALEHELDQHRRSPAALRPPLEREQREAEHNASRLRSLAPAAPVAAKRNPSGAIHQTQEGAGPGKPDTLSKTSEPAPDQVSPAPRGLVLRFASNEALRALARANRVRFYALVGRQAWRLAAAGGAPRFEPAAAPSSFHEMAPYTVPQDLAGALRASVAVFRPEQVTWAVILPVDTEAAIRRLLRKATAGELVIAADGSVRAEPSTDPRSSR